VCVVVEVVLVLVVPVVVVIVVAVVSVVVIDVSVPVVIEVSVLVVIDVSVAVVIDVSVLIDVELLSVAVVSMLVSSFLQPTMKVVKANTITRTRSFFAIAFSFLVGKWIGNRFSAGCLTSLGAGLHLLAVFDSSTPLGKTAWIGLLGVPPFESGRNRRRQQQHECQKNKTPRRSGASRTA
jgi:hypothetical protein